MMNAPAYAPGIEDYKRICAEIDPPDFYRHSYFNQRSFYLDLFRAFPIPRPRSVHVRDDALVLADHQIPLRIFRRHDAGDALTPCIIYAHGGGFINGNLEASDSIAADLADRLRLTVITLHYRLAPEYRHPAALEDCYSTLEWIAERGDALYRIDPRRILFAGESCGGNFAAAVALLSRDRNGPKLFGQVPINPIFDLHRWAFWEATEYPQDAQVEMNHYTHHYLNGQRDYMKCYASPLLADSLEDLPPAFLWAAECDPLADEARAFAARLAAARVPCELHIEKGVVHGCLRARRHYGFAARGFENLVSGIARLLALSFALV
ncbi:MAG TPA: alpha/beta hydrolase [Dongiaceae bacterium]|jgi:acetyl esterase|nr:alpha/beta hydrolase [Dongiaceae bacterium]